MRSVAGVTAFVTGAANSLGAALTRALAEGDARLVIADTDAAALEAQARALRAGGAEALALAFDPTDEDAWTAARERAADFGPVRILFSNSTARRQAADGHEPRRELWGALCEADARTHLYACRTFLDDMKRSGEPGHVVITAPTLAAGPCAGLNFAAVAVTLALRKELMGDRVGVSLLCPGLAAAWDAAGAEASAALPKGAESPSLSCAEIEAILTSEGAARRVAAQVIGAVRTNTFHIFTQPHWRRLVAPRVSELMTAFGCEDGFDAAPAHPAPAVAANDAEMGGTGRFAAS